MIAPTYEELLDEASKTNKQLADLIRIKNVIQFTKKKPLLKKGYYYDSRGRKRKIRATDRDSV
jgi:hypothetical protein